jgi:hypothetical protein
VHGSLKRVYEALLEYKKNPMVCRVGVILDGIVVRPQMNTQLIEEVGVIMRKIGGLGGKDEPEKG